MISSSMVSAMSKVENGTPAVLVRAKGTYLTADLKEGARILLTVLTAN